MLHRKNGTIRTQRLPKELLDSPFKIDGKSSSDLLGYLVAYLEKLNYYNLDNEVDGNWKKLVENDPVIYTVIIINTPLTSLSEILEKAQKNIDYQYDKSQIILVLHKWYDQIIEWHLTLQKLGEKQLSNTIKMAVRDVLEDQKKIFDRSIDTPQEERVLLESVRLFHKIILHLKEYTKTYLNEGMYKHNTHLPHNAMYIAFVTLYKIVQDKLNTISRRHLDFYYKDILQQKVAEAKPTRATLVFEVLPTETQSLIEKGTLVSAGKMLGSNTDIHFQTEKPLCVHQVEIEEMQTLFFNTNPFVEIGTNQPIISSVKKNKLISKGKKVEDENDWFVFGANKETLQNTIIDSATTAHLGCIIGSPVLALDEGKRKISLHFNLTETTVNLSLIKLITEISSAKDISLERAYSLVFDTGFSIFYTSKEGWIPFENYSTTFANNKLSLHFTLEKSDPSLTIGTTTAPPLQWPAIKILLNEYAPIYAYSFLKKLEIETVHIDVSVEDIRNIALYNNVGKMPLGKSFEAFGPTPSKGNYILIGKSELFKKNVQTVDVKLQWDVIPEDYGGFTSYYDGYSKEITNTSFVVNLQTLTNSYWVPQEAKLTPTAPLFTTQKCTTPEGYESELLSRISTITISDFKQFDTALDFNIKEPLKYEVNSQSGFLKITLASPSFGFGNDIYQQEFTEIATYNAKNKRQVPYPNKPFVPKLKGVTLNYTASDTLYFDSNSPEGVKSEKNLGEFIHILPSGYNPIVANQKVKNNLMLPYYPAQGYFFMGLKGVSETTTITIFFHFLRSGTTIKIKKNTLVWEYFLINRWVRFKPDQIINDGTGGLTKTGIIELVLPEIITDQETATNSLYWIRISTKQSGQHFPKIKAVYLNATSAICINPEASVKGATLPPGSIDTLVLKNAAIKRVYQPANTYAGAMAEQEDSFYSRISERLRHKSRAVATWDYERLILENFDNVKVVKCTNFDANYHPEPGKVKVAVLSKYWSNDERFYFKKGTLEAMQRFLEKRANQFVSIQVLNPIAEYLLVHVVVDFAREDRGGFYIDELNNDISEYMSPIKNIEHGMGGIGGSVVPNMVLSFIENLPYITAVKKLAIEHIVGKTNQKYTYKEYSGGSSIRATTPWSILAPVKRHHIISAQDTIAIDSDTLKVAIENMEIGLDFILKDDPVALPLTKTQSPSKKTKDAIFAFTPKTSK